MNNDLKSSDALKAYAREVICGQNPTNSLLIRMFDEIIDNAPSPWIPVSERLPNWWEAVLVTDECGKVFEYERRPVDDDGNLCREWRFLGRKIIAWMPEPGAYKKEDTK